MFLKIKFLRCLGSFGPGFGFLVIFYAICAIFRPKRCLGAEFWARTKFRNFRDCNPPFTKPPSSVPVRKKLIAIFSGEIPQRDFTLPGGPGDRFGLHFGSPWGSCWPSFWRSVLKMRKSQFLQTVHTKTLIFRVPGASRAPFLEPKTGPKTS